MNREPCAWPREQYQVRPTGSRESVCEEDLWAGKGAGAGISGWDLDVLRRFLETLSCHHGRLEER